jgi:hypothetical protein
MLMATARLARHGDEEEQAEPADNAEKRLMN